MSEMNGTGDPKGSDEARLIAFWDGRKIFFACKSATYDVSVIDQSPEP
jgi:hypothetical protein